LEVDFSLRSEESVADFMRHERTVSSTERDRLTEQMGDLGVDVMTGTGRLSIHTLWLSFQLNLIEQHRGCFAAKPS
jgi:hypothetical protein